MVEWWKNVVDFIINGENPAPKSRVAAQQPENVICIYYDTGRHYV